MGSLKINENTTIKTLKESFKETFSGTLRIYAESYITNENITLESLCKEKKPNNDIVVTKEWSIKTFTKKILKEYGIKVKIYTYDNWIAIPNEIKLEDIHKIKTGRPDMNSYIKHNYQ